MPYPYGGEEKSHSLNDSPPKDDSTERGEKRVTPQWKSLTNTIWARWPRSASTVISHMDSTSPWCDRRAGYPRNTLHPSLTTGKTPDKSQLRDILQNYLTSPAQNYQGHKKQGKSEELSQQEESKATWWLNATWSPGWDPGTEKGHWVKTEEI